jgi:hypothetical protein
LLRSDQFVVAVPEEGKQIIEKFAETGGAYVIVQVQLTNPAAEINPQVLIIEHAELPVILDQQFVAVLVKSGDAEAGQTGPTQLLLHPLPHFLCGIFGIGYSENFIGPGVSFPDQMGDAPGKNCGFASTRSGDDKDRAVDVFDGFALALIRLERSRR